MKNYLHQTLFLTLLVVGIMGLLSAFSKPFALAGHEFRKVDIFQDIRREKPAESPSAVAIGPTYPDHPADSAAHQMDQAEAFTNRIEDYTPDKKSLAQFFRAIDSIKTHGHQVRVAFFGDSFVEGDILIGDLRDTLQSLWGGRGVGYVPITSEVAPYRRTFKQTFKGWKTYGIVKNPDSGQDFGLNGFVYLPDSAAKIHYEGFDYFKNTNRWADFRLFYSATKPVSFIWQNEGSSPTMEALKVSGKKINEWKCPNSSRPLHAFAASFPQASGLKLYGASLETESGFFIDNFSMRGLTGGKMKLIRDSVARQFDQMLDYELVVVQLGLNAATPSLQNIPWYEKELDETFIHLKRCFPGKPILIISIADRANKVEGNLATMPSVVAIHDLQKRLSEKHGLLFWDMFNAMGGSGTMIRFAHQRPALANKDYTHLTHEGGKHMGKLVAELFLAEKHRLSGR